MFSQGDVIVRREVFHGAVYSGVPAHVVEDTPDLLAIFVQTGSEIGFPPHKFHHQWKDRGIFTWQGHGKLSLQRPDDAYSVDVFWDGPDRDFSCWYLNLQEPFHRTPLGFDTMDHEIDVLVLPDGSIHEKDQDLFAEAVQNGKFSAAEAGEILTTRDHVVEMVRGGDRWWNDNWREWAPPASWTAEALPHCWAQLPTGRV